MKQKFLSMTFTSNGEKVDVLSKPMCRPEDVMSALSFLDVGRTLTIEVKEIDVPNPVK